MSDETTTTATEQPQAACERCGKPEAAKFGYEFICDECYTVCGSCCAGEAVICEASLSESDGQSLENV